LDHDIEDSADAATRALSRAAAHASAYLAALDRTSVSPTLSSAEVRASLDSELPEEGLPPDKVIEDLVAAAEGGLIGSAGGRFFGWVMGGALPSALAADWLTSVWDQNAALHASGPAAAIVEEVVGRWAKELIGLPPEASFALTTGCQMAHVTCLAAARHHLLAARGWDVEARGLSGAPPISLLASDAVHGSIERAMRLLGMGTDRLVRVGADGQGALPAEGLAAALEALEGAPAIVLLQAGDINRGAFDDFARLVPIARGAGAWIHVDGAFGLWAAAAPSRRHLVRGVALADSWATDAHKWLNVPYDSGLAFVRQAGAHRAALSHRAAYLVHAEESRDQIDWSPEWSRRARGFAVYAALRELGRAGVADLIERTCAHTEALVEGLERIPEVEVLARPVINQALVRFPDPAAGAGDAEHDRRTDAVIDAIVTDGEAFFGGTLSNGVRAMRISVCNWRTTEEDVRRAVAAVERALASVGPSSAQAL
jgi:glutamate/tyrosine decarboxylase-like PLP-dependent enzyme